MGSALGEGAAGIGRGVLDGAEDLIARVGDPVLIDEEFGKFHANEIPAGVAVEDALEKNLGGDGIALVDALEAGEVEVELVAGLAGNDLEEDDILLERVREEILGIRNRAGPLGEFLVEEGALGPGILKGFSGDGLGVDDLEIGADEVFPSHE